MRLVRPMLLLVALSAALALSSSPVSAASDSYAGVSFHPFTMDASNGSCTLSPDEHGATKNCDPINLIFPGKTWQQVRDALRARGWTTAGVGSTQYLHVGDGSMVPQDVQLFRKDGGDRRYHIRLWQARGTTPTMTVAGVHHEQRVKTSHVIEKDWDVAEAFVAGQFCPSATCTSTDLLTQQWSIQGQDQEWRGKKNDAQATVLSGF